VGGRRWAGGGAMAGCLGFWVAAGLLWLLTCWIWCCFYVSVFCVLSQLF